ncbi:sensor histidine kinase [Mucilaginibacter rigui]|uniref:Sensor histidine kinase n=1 Tax=Mucilaginibacter rigui TaxID=534635 RepID=A0ABR7X9L9_9SPHI|nr:sensor histidine kinase [Mucilaginibacter rigui]MBD1387282.1 sensor histidine kinase [Mucilaginibacter rigui]
MLLLKSKPTIGQLQWMVWVFVFLVVTLSLVAMDGFLQGAVYALLNTAFYAAIVYGNILWLFPRLYLKGRIIWYVLAVILFLLAIGAARAFVTLYAYNLLFAKHPEPMSMKAIASMVVGGIMIFLLSFIFRIALAYFTLKQQSEEIIAQKTQAELNLLKSQVQPHFLFNTLNNIYYEAYLEAPRTASLIERLSDIMRYFVDESPKQEVSLATEIQFLENYITLENIRIRYDVDITFNKNCDTTKSLPPMLLITFVENIFKHGIDKSSSDNKIEIELVQQNRRFIFTTTNTTPDKPLNSQSTGFGIENLRKRLVLLYGNDFELQVQNKGDIYVANLNIPLA